MEELTTYNMGSFVEEDFYQKRTHASFAGVSV
jgi:hypothetical protein